MPGQPRNEALESSSHGFRSDKQESSSLNIDPVPSLDQASSSIFMVGTDPSAGDDTRIFGIDIIDQVQLDATLAPEDLPGKDMGSLYERFMDVASLPRNSVGPSDQDFGLEEESARETMEMTALAMTQAASSGKSKRALLFSSPRNNVLIRVNSEETLIELAGKIRLAAEEDLKTQTKQLRSFMAGRGYSLQAIMRYVDSGGLPRLVLWTLDLYKQLIDAVITATRVHSEVRWMNSYAQTMISYHG